MTMTNLPPLTGAQKSKLRGLAQKLPPVARIGKQGLHDALITNVADALDKRCLVKVRFDEFKDQRKEFSRQLAAATNSHLIEVIGHVAVIYRPGPNDPLH